jgi:hypothetical protein
VKIVRWAAAAALTLISLMDVGTVTGGVPVAVRVLVALLGVLGLATVYGLLRRRHWGTPGALAAGTVNVVAALIGLAVSSDGAVIGLAVSVVALGLTAAATYAGRAAQPADLTS